MEHFEVRSGAATLAGERHGEGEPLVVALHAGVADRRSWRPVAQLLSDVATVIAYDRRGFGETVAPPEDHAHVADLLAVLDAQAGATPAWLMGSSQGGRIALDLCLETPDRVAGLILVAPAVSGDSEFDLSPAEIAVAEALDAAEEDEDVDAVNRIEAHIWLDGPSCDEGRVGGTARDLFLDMNGTALSAPDPGEVDEPADATQRLGEIDKPVLVIYGDLDVTGIRARAEELAGRLPDARSVVMEDTAHLPYVERPAEFATLVRVALAR